MYCEKDIIKEGNPLLSKKCAKVNVPLSKADKECIRNLAEYLIISEDEEKCKELGIRPGVGIAAPQVGVIKRMFAMNATDFLDENHKKYTYYVVNPEIISRSKLEVYLPGGEGCLSVDRATDNMLTPRNYKIVARCTLYDLENDKLKFEKLTLEGYPAIVFQHEYDHLDGIMYVDKMFTEDEMKARNVVPLYTLEGEDDESDAE